MAGFKMKHDLRKDLMQMYGRQGYLKTKDYIDRLYYESTRKPPNTNSIKHLRGELAEIVLELLVREFVRKYPECFYVKGLTLRNLKQENRYTELDITLFTKSCVYLFESKSLRGGKLLIEDCKIRRSQSDSVVNVYGQNKHHLDTLHANIHEYKIKPGRGYKLVLFEYSDSPLKDVRMEDMKERFPYVNEKTLSGYLEKHLGEETVWNMPGLYRFISDEINKSDYRFKKHVVNMKRLKEGDD